MAEPCEGGELEAGRPAKRMAEHLRMVFGDESAGADAGAIIEQLTMLGMASADVSQLLSLPEAAGLEAALRVWRRRREVSPRYRPDTVVQYLTDAAIYAALLQWLQALALRDSLTAALSRDHAGLRKTVFLYSSYLAHSLFEAARRLADEAEARSNGYFAAAIRASEQALTLALPYELEEQERYLRGYMGVSHLLLAFSAGAARTEHLREAVLNLRRSGQLGDNSFERARYFGTALSELAEVSEDSGLLTEATSALRYALALKAEDADSLVALGRVLMQTSAARKNALGTGDAVCLREATACIDRALLLGTRFRVANLRGRRGQAFLFLAWETSDAEALNSAVDDLRFAHTAQETQWAPLLIQALLTRQALAGDSSGVDALEAWNTAKQGDGATMASGVVLDLHSERIRAAYTYGRVTGNVDALLEVRALAKAAEVGIRAKATGLLGLSSGDRRLLEEAIEALQTCPRTSEGPGLLPKLASVLAHEICEDDPGRALELLNIAALALDVGATRDDPLHLWLAAKNRFFAWKVGGDADDLEDALLLADQARTGRAAPTPENLVLAADIELQAAKGAASGERRRALLEAALGDLQAGVPLASGLNPAVSDGKLGEILLRLGAATGSPDTLVAAQVALSSAYDRGNRSSAACGLLGDAYYHYSKACATAERRGALKEALRWKERARTAVPAGEVRAARLPSASREHYSLCARMHLQLHELGDRDEMHSARSLDFIALARSADPLWPWPVCQLAETLGEPMADNYHDPDPAVQNAAQARDAHAVWARAAELTLASAEYRSGVLGGKSDVWYADDRLGLVSSVFVFKPSPPATIRRVGVARAGEILEEEMQRMQALGVRLAAEPQLRVSLPDFLGVLMTPDGRPVLAMRRLSGQTLAETLLRQPALGLAHLHAAIRALALYHATTPIAERGNERDLQRQRLSGVLQRCTEPSLGGVRDVLTRRVTAATELPLVGRRDAHPGNWFVTSANTLVILDIEYPTCKLFLEEVAQLVDDIPALGWSEASWAERKGMVGEYCRWYADYGGGDPGVSPEAMWEMYMTFAGLLGLFGLSLSEAQLRDSSLTPVEGRTWSTRRDHYGRLAIEMARGLEELQAS